MSKTKLAILLFCVAFGLNVIAFVFSKKTYTVEEVKNVWLYELPPTLSPLDAYPATQFGPHQGVIGTLFLPSVDDGVIETELADHWSWNEHARELRVTLKPALYYSDGTPITAPDWVASLDWVRSQSAPLGVTPEWQAFLQMQAAAPDPNTLVLRWEKLPAGFDFLRYAQQVLTHPVSGVLHPSNLARLKAGEAVVKSWISSGPYKVQKWNPKEITLISRDVFPIQMPKEFFRTLRYQSAPVKNPSCEFMQANAQETRRLPDGKVQSLDKDLSEHTVVSTDDEVHVLWICRSWKQAGRFCADPVLRQGLSQAITGEATGALQGQSLQYRIPTGSDQFRSEFRKRLVERLSVAGAQAKEVSYFFKNSADADLELAFVVTPAGPSSSELATRWMQLSSRLGSGARVERYVAGEIFKFPVAILLKRMKAGNPFRKVFLEPDLDEKKLPI